MTHAAAPPGGGSVRAPETAGDDHPHRHEEAPPRLEFSRRNLLALGLFLALMITAL